MIAPSKTSVAQKGRPLRYGRLTGERWVDATNTDWRQVRWFDGYTGWVIGRTLRAVSD